MINDENTRKHFTSNMGFNRQWLGYKQQDMETLRMCHDQNTSSHTIIDLYGDGHPTVLRIPYMGYLSTCDFRGVWPSLFPWSLWIMSEQGARRHGPSSDLYQPFPSLPKYLWKRLDSVNLPKTADDCPCLLSTGCHHSPTDLFASGTIRTACGGLQTHQPSPEDLAMSSNIPICWIKGLWHWVARC
jgi:hypothetical protein